MVVDAYPEPQRPAPELPALSVDHGRRQGSDETAAAVSADCHCRWLSLHTAPPTCTARHPSRRFCKLTVTRPNGSPAPFTPWFGALAHAIFFRAGSLDYFHTHVCAAGMTGCTSVLGPTRVTGSATAARSAPRRRPASRAGHLAALPAVQGGRPRPHRSLYPEGAMSRRTFKAAGLGRYRCADHPARAHHRVRPRSEPGRATARAPGGWSRPAGADARRARARGLASRSRSAGLLRVAVRERALLERRALVAPVRSFRVGRAVSAALVLAVVTSFAGGFVEAYLHWRAGLGWHGLRCVFGPLHRDLLPIETGFSFVAAALHRRGRAYRGLDAPNVRVAARAAAAGISQSAVRLRRAA